ncbi:hypothetical protein QYF36_012586 [Acer negundo]|nr:hypothetical protein QYF36_012586 [Acer negundo]
MKTKNRGLESREEEEEVPLIDMSTIAAATNNFSQANMIGKGGFGPVYKGNLSTGQEIAIKRLSNDSGQDDERSKFLSWRKRGDDKEANTKRIAGTYGYMSPEYATDGKFSLKSDVFSFGVLLLEIVSGKKNRGFCHPDHHLNLLGHAWVLWNNGKALEVKDVPNLDFGSFGASACLELGSVGVNIHTLGMEYSINLNTDPITWQGIVDHLAWA